MVRRPRHRAALRQHPRQDRRRAVRQPPDLRGARVGLRQARLRRAGHEHLHVGEPLHGAPPRRRAGARHVRHPAGDQAAGLRGPRQRRHGGAIRDLQDPDALLRTTASLVAVGQPVLGLFGYVCLLYEMCNLLHDLVILLWELFYTVVAMASPLACFSSPISPYRSSSTLKISASGSGVFPAVKTNTLFFTSIQLCPGFFLKPASFVIILTLFESSHIPQVAYKFVTSMWLPVVSVSACKTLAMVASAIAAFPCILQELSNAPHTHGSGLIGIVSMSSDASFSRPVRPRRSTIQV